MNTRTLTRKDFVEIDGYLHYEKDFETDGHLKITSNLGWIKFKFGINIF